jgi:hypothetical protein
MKTSIETPAMKYLTVELLVFMNADSSFCKTEDSFDSLLKSNADISIKKDIITFKGSDFNYKLTSGKVNDPNIGSRYFDIKIKTSKINDANIELLSDLTREIRVIIGKVTDFPAQTIWDDLSYYYATQAYPLIHEIENILRKLITKFMLINVGISWPKNSIPDALKSPSRDGSDRFTGKDKSNNHNILYDTDFIKLSDFLFEEYKEIDASELIKCLRKISLDDCKNKEILDRTLKFIPKSNWDRYFSKHIDCHDEFLKKKWVRLYELRCQIAHNNTFSKSDFEETINIISEIKPHLEKANDKLEDIIVSNEEKESLVESIELNEITARITPDEIDIRELMKNIEVITYLLYRIAKISDPLARSKDIDFIIESLEKWKMITSNTANFLTHLYKLSRGKLDMRSLDGIELNYLNRDCAKLIISLTKQKNDMINVTYEDY